jgi:hypothetical protein
MLARRPTIATRRPARNSTCDFVIDAPTVDHRPLAAPAPENPPYIQDAVHKLPQQPLSSGWAIYPAAPMNRFET